MHIHAYVYTYTLVHIHICVCAKKLYSNGFVGKRPLYFSVNLETVK